MRNTKHNLESKVEELCLRVLEPRVQKKVTSELLKENGIPVSITSDILTLRRDPSTESIFVLYHILRKLDKDSVDKFFTEKEQAEFSKEKFEAKDVKFPLKFKAIQIKDDQWVSSITVKELMNFSKAQMINYNENAQRVLKRIIKGGEEVYRIQLNKAAVNAIEESFRLGRYIPNMLTLNIPQDDDSDFFYNETTGELVIKKIKMFDILDGYHRYVAMCNLFIQDSSFDYPFELRITNFSDEKARQFIWQEDQKTKMSRVDSNALNNYNNGNIIVSKLKDSNYGSLIGRNNIIDEAVLSEAINAIFVTNKKKRHTNSEIIKFANIIKNGFCEIEESNPSVFDKELDPRFLYCMLVAFFYAEYDYKVIKEFTQEMIESSVIFNRRQLTSMNAKKLKHCFMERRGE